MSQACRSSGSVATRQVSRWDVKHSTLPSTKRKTNSILTETRTSTKDSDLSVTGIQVHTEQDNDKEHAVLICSIMFRALGEGLMLLVTTIALSNDTLTSGPHCAALSPASL